MRRGPEVYNPLDKMNIAKSVAAALLARPLTPLMNLDSFDGAGIYAIYYAGNFIPYQEISISGEAGADEPPIYVGKAIPAGARKGGLGLDSRPGSAMFKRLNDHAQSIEQASNLGIEDFYCRFLLVDDIWIPLGENLLISRFSPIWNKLIDGFGNHNPGSGRLEQLRSRWDVLHPGRSWADKFKHRDETGSQIELEVANFLGRLL